MREKLSTRQQWVKDEYKRLKHKEEKLAHEWKDLERDVDIFGLGKFLDQLRRYDRG